MKIENSQKDKVFMNGEIESEETRVFYKDPTKGEVSSVKLNSGDNMKKIIVSNKN